MSTPASSSSAPHVLYVAWGFPPCRGGGVYRALATANAFAAAGMRVTVLTADRETFTRFTGTDLSLEEKVDPRIEVVRVPFEWPVLETDVRRWSATRAFFPRLWLRRRKRLDVRDFPEVGYGPWRRPLEAAADRIQAADPVDLVVASANPNVDFTVAAHLHRTHGVPYVMDYRDAWTLDVFDGTQVHADDSEVARLEREYVAGAREVWFVNEPIRAWHQERYPHHAERMHVVANGYDPEFAPVARTGPPPPDRPLRFGYIGTVSPKVPLKPFADGWALARSRTADLDAATAEVWGYLGYYATPSPALLRIVDDHAADGLRYAGPLPKQRVREVYDTFDATLLILGKGKYVTSGKVFEYTASALPIVSVHDPGNAASDVLRDYPLWFPVDELTPEAVARAVEAAAHAARHASAEQRAACAEFAARCARDLQLRPRVEALAAGLGLPTPVVEESRP
ncbi:glycosyl transferase [Phycicoccus sp.]|uniref:glycosyl transferase n=1 Tax=Phycicoccus sp. TaxID=1902410 RepID=UPI002C48C4B9|nr:glycosyl transferase [Phycicoccus sp.]HMM95709.1 glycosyltransferase [Phycicoccus sp.]